MRCEKVSPAGDVGECWICGSQRFRCWLRRTLRRTVKHPYDPIRVLTFSEFERLDAKYKGGLETHP